ncbi:hypothetical protein Misp05_45420 [Micromonospora sp. NBRC 107095]|nr:hypothetical protein Misp05_45420 [Micromonospora sp. NBRC 107095]
MMPMIHAVIEEMTSLIDFGAASGCGAVAARSDRTDRVMCIATLHKNLRAAAVGTKAKLRLDRWGRSSLALSEGLRCQYAAPAVPDHQPHWIGDPYRAGMPWMTCTAQNSAVRPIELTTRLSRPDKTGQCLT